MNWISVKDRLPGFDKEVLLYTPSDGIRIGSLSLKDRTKYCANYSFKVWDHGWSGFDQYITHWQLLPEPPEVTE